MTKLDELTLLMFEAQGEHTDKTGLQIIEEEIHEKEQIERAFKQVETTPYEVARKHAKYMEYKFNVEPIVEKILTQEQIQDIKDYIHRNYYKFGIDVTA